MREAGATQDHPPVVNPGPEQRAARQDARIGRLRAAIKQEEARAEPRAEKLAEFQAALETAALEQQLAERKRGAR